MAGLFRDPSDANRRPRGVRPFAGQTHQPGTGPIKGNPVRRPTVAPFESPFAERKRSSPTSVRASTPAPDVDAQAEAQSPIDMPGIEDFAQETATPAPDAIPYTHDRAEVQLSDATDLIARPESVLRTQELLERHTEDAPSELSIDTDSLDVSPAGEAETEWFSGDVDPESLYEAPFDNIESLEAAPAVEALELPEPVEPPATQLRLSADWAVSPEGEADLEAYVAETRSVERASEVLETVARRVRSGEIVVGLEPGATTEAVLAAVLASLLANPT